jgi:hypothetical protein
MEFEENCRRVLMFKVILLQGFAVFQALIVGYWPGGYMDGFKHVVY